MNSTLPTLLVIEDDPMMVLFLEAFLQPTYIISKVDSGGEAIKMLNTEPKPSMVVMDLFLPDMKGFQIIEWVRSKAEFDNVPILVLSGSSKSEDRVRALDSGADDFVVKPFNPDELKARVKNLLRRFAQLT